MVTEVVFGEETIEWEDITANEDGSITVTAPGVETVRTVEVSVTTGAGDAGPLEYEYVDGEGGDGDLTITPIADQEGPVGVAIDPIDVEVSDPEAGVTVDGLPDGLTYNSETSVIEGTPEEGTEGPYDVIVTASLGEDEVTEEFTFVVTDGDDIAAPMIAPIDDQQINLGNPITPVTVNVTGEDVEVGVTGLPTGVTFDPATLEISGTPTAAGNSTVTVTATNSGGEVFEAFVITVVEEGGGNGDSDIDGPEITPIDNQDGVVGEPIESIDVDVTGEDVTVVVEGLPDGLNYNEETSVIEGTPGENTEGNHTVTVNASNEGGDDSTAFIITITDEDGGDNGSGPGGSLPGSSEGDNGSGGLFPGGSSDLFPGSSNGENGNGNGGNSSSEQLQQCLASPETGLAALLSVLGVTAAVSGPVIDPIVRAVGEQFSEQVRRLTGSTPENDPEWLNQINAGLAEASQALDSRIVATALFGAGALALIFADDLCGTGNEGLSSQLSS